MINKMWGIITTEHYWAIRRNEVLFYATTWMDLENIMLRKRPDTKDHVS